MTKREFNEEEDVRQLKELLDLAATQIEATSAPKADAGGHRGEFWNIFDLWVKATNITPGVVPGLASQDLYRHLLEFCHLNGLELPAKCEKAFGKSLSALGLRKGRLYVNGRDSKPFLLSGNSAFYFRAWLRANPTPPVNQGPYVVGANVARQRKKDELAK